MTEKQIKIVAPIAILAVGLVATVAMIKLRRPVPTRPPTEFAPLVRMVEARSRTERLTVTAQGTVTPRTETTIVAEVAGRVLSTAPEFASGGFFEAGDVLLSVDPVDYRLAVVTARGQVAQARVRLETEEANAAVAREEWESLGKGTGSPLATRKLQVDEARAALDAAVAKLEKAQRDLERTQIRSPFACRVREKLADLGRYVTPGTPVARIYAIDYAEVRLPIPDADLAYLDLPADYRGGRDNDPGPEVRLSAEFAGKRWTWAGRIVRVEGEIDPASRMVHVVARVDDPYGRAEDGRPPLAIGLFVDATIVGKRLPDAVVLPRSAMREGNRVLVIDGESRLNFRAVDVVKAERDSVVIGSGLSAGERVCVSPLSAATDGMIVRTANDAPPAANGPSDGDDDAARGDGS